MYQKVTTSPWSQKKENTMIIKKVKSSKLVDVFLDNKGSHIEVQMLPGHKMFKIHQTTS